jgi:PAS domain S-box-containing protein
MIKHRNVSLAIIIAISAILILINYFTIRTTSAVRAYINGESKYSKGQKDAARHLTRYITSADTFYYNLFLEQLKVPLGDSIARQGLTRNSETEIIKKGFLQGKNHQDDLDDMIWLFRNFNSISFMKRAIQIWKEADVEVGKLSIVGDRVRQKYRAGNLSASEKENLIAEIEILTSELTVKEREFSDVLGGAARSINNYLFYSNIVLTLLIIGSVGSFWSSIVRRLAQTNKRLKETLHLGKMGSAVLNLKAQEVTFSRELLRIFDLPDQEPTIIPIRRITEEFIVPEDRHKIHETIEQGIRGAKAGGVEIDLELRIRSAVAIEKLLNVRAQFRGDEAFGIVQDITAMRKMELESINKGRRIENILYSITDGFYAVDQNWTFTLVNPVFEKIANKRPGYLAGTNLWDEFPEVADTELERALRLAASTLTAQYVELSPTANQNAYFDVHIYPNSEGLFVYFRNSTNQRLVSLALESTNEMLKRVVSSSSEALWEIDLQNESTYFSDRWKEMFGYTDEELTNIWSDWPKFIHPDEIPVIAKAIDEIIPGQQTKFIFELRMLKKNGRYTWTKLHSVIAFDDNGRAVKITGSNTNIEERKLAEIALKERNELFSKLSENVPGMIFNFYLAEEDRGIFPFVSYGAKVLFDLEPSALMGDASLLFNIVHPEDLNPLMDSIKKAYYSNGEWRAEFRIVKNNSTRWIIGESYPYTEKDGSYYWYGYLSDFTDRKVAEEAIRQSETLLRTIYEAEPECINIMNRDGSIVEINPAGIGMIEADHSDQVIGKSIDRLITAPYKKAFKELTEKVFNGESEKLEFDIIGLKGTQRSLETTAVPLRDAKGVVTSLLGITRDVTESKLAAERIRRKEEKRKLIMNASLDAIICLDTFGKITFWNSQAEIIFGWSQVEILDKPIADTIIPSHLREQHSKRLNLYLQKGEAEPLNKSFESAALNKAGIEFPVELSIVSINQNEEQFFCAFVRDITERKRAQQELQQVYEKLDAMLNASTDSTFFIDPEGRMRVANVHALENTDRLFNTKVEIGDLFSDCLPPEYQSAFISNFNKALHGDLVDFEAELPVKNGKSYWFRVSYLPVRNSQNQIIGVSYNNTDITEQKHAEILLRESEHRFRTLADAAPVLIWMSDTNKMRSYLNKGWLDFTGRTEQQELGTGWTSGIHPDDLVRNRYSYSVLFDKRAEFRMEYRLKRHDGEYRWLIDHGKPRYLSTGEFVGYIGSCFDIHDRKQAEESLQFTRFTIDHASDPIFWIAKDGRLIDFNPAASLSLGYSHKELIALTFADLCIVDGENFWSDQWNELRQKRSMTFPGRMRRKNGSSVDVEINTNYIIFKGQEFNCAFVRDVTERKKSEILLRESQDRYRMVVEDQSDMILRYQPDGSLSFVNNAMAAFFGISAEMFIGKKFADIMPEHNKALTIEEINKALKKDRSAYAVPQWMMSRQGELRWFEWQHSPLLNENGDLYEVQVIGRDITYRKKLEEEQLRLDNIIRESHNEIFLINAQTLQFEYANKAALKNVGYDLEELKQIGPLEMMRFPDRNAVTEFLKPLTQRSTDRLEFTGRHYRKDGSMYHVNKLLQLTKSETAYVGIASDITEQKEKNNLLEIIRYLQSTFITQSDPNIFFDFALELILQITESKYGFIGEVLYNDGVPCLKTTSFNTMVRNKEGKSFYEKHVDGLVFHSLKSVYSQVMVKGETVISNERYIDDRNRELSEDHPRVNCFAGIPLFKGEQMVGLVGLANRESGYTLHGLEALKPLMETLSNIIEAYRNEKARKHFENQLLDSIKEKDTLIKEIHHRVKNNLQLISSILFIRMKGMAQSEIKDFLEDTRQKIRSIALIHERLLQTGSVNEVDISDYLGKLIADLRLTNRHPSLQLSLDWNIESEKMNLDTAIYCGLITNELVTNAIKHAFNNSAQGKIDISLRRKESVHILTVADNGSSLPEDVWIGESNSFGMQLLDIFIKQIGGTVTIGRENGTCFTIMFK